MSRFTTNLTKWSVHQAKTQTSLGIHPVWSVFAVCSMGSWGLNVSSCGQWRLWSDWADAQADHPPSLIWVFAGRKGHFIRFVMRQPKSLISAKMSLWLIHHSYGICDFRNDSKYWLMIDYPIDNVNTIKVLWAATWQNQQNGCAPSEDSDQSGHPPSLIRVFPVRSMGS